MKAAPRVDLSPTRMLPVEQEHHLEDLAPRKLPLAEVRKPKSGPGVVFWVAWSLVFVASVAAAAFVALALSMVLVG